MSDFRVPETLTFIGWSSNSRLLRGAERHEFADREELLEAMRRLGAALEHQVATEIVYVGRQGPRTFGYWFGTDCGENYVYVLEAVEPDWLEQLHSM